MRCLGRWAQQYPESVAALSEIRHARLRCGPFSGFHPYIYGLRQTDDLDLFTHADDFHDVRRLLPDGATVRSRITMYDRRGERIRFLADELRTVLDGITVQVIRPLSPVVIGGREYDLSMTDLAASRMQTCLVAGALIPMVSVADTLLAKALFQRGNGKHDWADTVGLAPACPYSEHEYLLQRAEESGFGEREFSFLGRAGIALPQAELAMPVAA
jgi:hypothetical protein